LTLTDNQRGGTEKKMLAKLKPKMIMSSLPAAASNSDCRSHPDCRAIVVCQKPPPSWLDEAVTQIVAARRTKEEAQRYLFDMVHYCRWDAVTELRSRASVTWDAAFKRVAELFAGTNMAGTADTIKKSYKIVERDMREGCGAKYFVSVDEQFRIR